MTVQSYLIHPGRGQLTPLCESLRQLPGCEVMPAQNREVLILVTETETAAQQKDLERRLECMDGIQGLALISGWTE